MNSTPSVDQSPAATEDLSGSVVLVTGATDGVGRGTALSLGRRGATVLAQGRSEAKAEHLERALARTSASDFETILVDFTDLEAVSGFASDVAARYDRLDVLVNNAGAYFDTGKLTFPGVERTIAVNHLAPFILTTRLLDLVEESEGRIVTTSSEIHRRSDFDIESLETTREYDGMEAYADSKFANVLFTNELAARLDDATTTCFHPGFIPSSGLYRNGSLPVRILMKTLSSLPRTLTSTIVSSPEDGAEAAVYLATSAAVADVSGAYFDGKERTEPARRTEDESLQKRLWVWSESVVEDLE